MAVAYTCGMAPRPLRPCKKPGCAALTQEANGYCAAHQEIAAEIERKRQRRGDERRESACKRGYGRRWSKIRAMQLRQFPLCAECMEREGRPEAADTVHHIDENPENNAPENLRSMCEDCHERLHGRRR